MSKFLTGKQLEDKLTDIIWNAKKHIVIVSPFIKLDSYVRDILEKVKSRHDISFFLLFGKNENSKNRSISEQDFNYFTEFKNIAILYNKDLHAKYYCNESEGLITSLNLYDYSMKNNIEYGVNFTTSVIGSDKLFNDTDDFTDDLLFEKSDVVFLKKPQYSKSLFGLKKNYQDSVIISDVSKDFFDTRGDYEKFKLSDFDLDIESSIEKKFEVKPERQKEYQQNNVEEKVRSSRSQKVFSSTNKKKGFCIRTGEEIPFNPERPYSYYAYKTWSQFENYEYAENYCHKTGKRSNGKTSMANPIL